jgi:ribose transport system substrate-binding protein
MNRISGRPSKPAIAFALAATVAMSACSSTQNSSSTVSGGPAGTSAPASGDNVAYAKAQIAQHQDVVDTFTPPGPTISGLSAVKGSTVTYIPLFLQSPYFGAEAGHLKEAFGLVGVTVQVCDGKATPTVVASCFDQAISGKSAGIITDAIPYGFALNAYTAAATANIPVVAGNVGDEVPAALNGRAATLGLRQKVIGNLTADSVIADAGGAAAHVLLVVATDSALTKENADALSEEFKTHCPDCVVSTANYRSTEIQKIPTTVGAALGKDPAISYVVCQFDEPAGPACLQGMQLRSGGAPLKLLTGGASLSGILRVKAGTQVADTSADPATAAWNEVDLLLRMMAKAPMPDTSAYVVPIRVFNASNIASVDATIEGFRGTSWYTKGGFKDAYKKLWAVAT